MSRLDLAVDSDNYIRVSGIIDNATDTVPSMNGVTAELLDDQGSTITNSSISLTAVSGKTDAYEGTFPDDVTLTDGQTVKVKVVATASGGTKRTWQASTTVSEA